MQVAACPIIFKSIRSCKQSRRAVTGPALEWGPGACQGAVVIGIGPRRGHLEAIFEVAAPADTIRCDYCVPYEEDLPVFVARRPKLSVGEVWPRVKHYR